MSHREVILAYPGDEPLASALAAAYPGATTAPLELRQFPDGESYVRLPSTLKDARVTIVCSLYQPDSRFLPLAMIASTARDLGAARVDLLCPYLSYMRQDERFSPGEGVTSRYMASLLCSLFDGLVTMDPHLHRHPTLDELYTIPNACVSSAPALARWLEQYPGPLVLVGPDEESEQWVVALSKSLGAPYMILHKTRKGDREVEIDAQALHRHEDATVVILDDIISTGRTMAKTVEHILAQGMRAPICVGVHAVFADDACALLREAGASEVVTCNTIPHPTNQIDVSATLAEGFWRWRATVTDDD